MEGRKERPRRDHDAGTDHDEALGRALVVIGGSVIGVTLLGYPIRVQGIGRPKAGLKAGRWPA